MKALLRLCICTCSSGPSLLAYELSINLVSIACAGFVGPVHEILLLLTFSQQRMLRLFCASAESLKAIAARSSYKVWMQIKVQLLVGLKTLVLAWDILYFHTLCLCLQQATALMCRDGVFILVLVLVLTRVLFSVLCCTLYLAKFMSTCTRTYLSTVTKILYSWVHYEYHWVLFFKFNQIGKIVNCFPGPPSSVWNAFHLSFFQTWKKWPHMCYEK